MSTGKPRDPRKEQCWRRLVHGWRGSGLSVRAYCERHGLAEGSFYAWRRILAERDAEAAPFARVRLLAETSAADGAGGSASGLELVLPNQRLLRIGPGFDAATLGRLLAVLEEGRSC